MNETFVLSFAIPAVPWWNGVWEDNSLRFYLDRGDWFILLYGYLFSPSKSCLVIEVWLWCLNDFIKCWREPRQASVNETHQNFVSLSECHRRVNSRLVVSPFQLCKTILALNNCNCYWKTLIWTSNKADHYYWRLLVKGLRPIYWSSC